MRALLLLTLAALGGCTANFKPDLPEPRAQIIATALDQVGRPYRYAGSSPHTGFDCSGLVHYSYAQSGIRVPRSTLDLLHSGEMISYEDAQPGDLVFYLFDDKRKPSSLHVVLFTGDGGGVHAPASGREVSPVRLNEPAWTSRYVGTVKLIPDL